MAAAIAITRTETRRRAPIQRQMHGAYERSPVLRQRRPPGALRCGLMILQRDVNPLVERIELFLAL